MPVSLFNVDRSTLKDGEIVVDKDTGKKYKAKKTVLSESYSGGPFGLGDPEDKSLRRIEVESIIPQMMNERIENVECCEALKEFASCVTKCKHFWNMRSCNSLKKKFLQCKMEKVRDVEFREAITEEYLKRRAEYRRTGKTEKQRAINEFLEWKRDHRTA